MKWLAFIGFAAGFTACSVFETQTMTRKQLNAATRLAIQTRETRLWTEPIPDDAIDAMHEELTGNWRVWVWPVDRKFPAGDDHPGLYVPELDGGRSLVFSGSGTLLSYKRADISPKWLQPKHE